MKRAPVQGERRWPRGRLRRGPGTVSWEEHEKAWRDYASKHSGQSAELIAERGGFSYGELTEHLGYEPKTWEAK